MDVAEEINSEWNCVGNPAESVSRQRRATIMAHRKDDGRGRRDVPEGYLSRLIRLTCWIVAEPRPRRRDLQIVLGRWLRVLMLRRAGMAFLRVCWFTVARPWREGPLSMHIRREVMQLCFGSPKWFADWRVGVCGRVSISDASPEGAGVCYSTKLSASGQRHAGRSPRSAADPERSW